MDNKTGESHEDVSNASGQDASTSVIPAGKFESRGILEKSLSRYTGALTARSDSEHDLAGVRRVRRGRYFLSRYDQLLYGSLSRPILQYYCHGLSVEEMEFCPITDGDWCFGSHNDFELIPENTPKEQWPAYVRTDTGFTLAANQEQLEMKEGLSNRLLELTKNLKRLT